MISVTDDVMEKYMMFLRFKLSGDKIILTKYQMQKDAVVGF